MSSAASTNSNTLLREAEEAQRLLRRGWRQLGACPSDCGAQLLGHQQEVFCVRCEQWFSPDELSEDSREAAAGSLEDDEEEDEEGFASLQQSANFRQLQTELQKDMQASMAASELSPEEAEQKQKIEAASERFDAVSAELGQRMLAGWTLLGDHCSECSCPLVRKPKSQQTACISCDLDGYRSKGAAVAAEESKAQDAPQQQQPTKKGVSGSASDDALAQIGARLLEGWALLAEVCPSGCLTPLVRDLDQQMWCLRCNVRVVRQKEIKAGLVEISPQPQMPLSPPGSTAEDDTLFDAEPSDVKGQLFSAIKSSPATRASRMRAASSSAASRKLNFAATAASAADSLAGSPAPVTSLLDRPLPAASQRKRRRSVVAIDNEQHPINGKSAKAADKGQQEQQQEQLLSSASKSQLVSQRLIMCLDLVTANSATALLERLGGLGQKQATAASDEEVVESAMMVPPIAQAVASLLDLRKQAGLL